MQPNNLSLTIAHLYPKSMNIYGDYGNILALKKRCEWRNIQVRIDEIEIGENLEEKKYDLCFAGGGQDKSQIAVSKDLLTKKEQIHSLVNQNIVFLTICGTYQLFGHYFLTSENFKITGISVFDLITKASNVRKIGNVVVKHNLPIKPETLVGFENHSGNTYLQGETQAIGKVIKGFGNNGKDKLEGARCKNVFGTYLHGSLLPKNPHFADYIIKLALENKYQDKIELQKLDDKLEFEAHNFILKNK
ncbi:glutamine amidotransferase [Candidatus Beckwithbacteria bacterium]|nr:glutamine amidotransferase [Candidatus Beckwithbacteria bacterium]